MNGDGTEHYTLLEFDFEGLFIYNCRNNDKFMFSLDKICQSKILHDIFQNLIFLLNHQFRLSA